MFSVEAAGQVNNQTNEFLYLRGNVNHKVDLSIEVDRHIRKAWCSFQKYTLKLYNRPSASLELKLRMLRAEVLETMVYDCVTWSPRACHYDTLRRVPHRLLTRCISCRKNNRADLDFLFLETLIKTRSESIRASLCRRQILFAESLVRMETRDCRSPRCSESWWARAVGGVRKRREWGVSWTSSELSASTSASGRLQPKTRGSDAGRWEKGGKTSWRN